MNYGSVCSGIEAATTAWRPLGWKAKFFAEVEPFPAAVLCHRYGATRPLRPLDPAEAADGKDRKLREAWARQLPGLPEGGDIPNLGDFTKIQKEDYEGDIDLLVGGTPCFPAGNLVLTEHGYAPIEEIRIGDMVMTHRGRLRKVLATGSKVAGNVGVCRIVGRPAFRVTANHPFLTAHGWRNNSRKSPDYARLQMTGPEFRPIGESVGEFAAYLNVNEHPCNVPRPEMPEVYSAGIGQILELCGWYLGDGYIRNFAECGKKAVILCLSQGKLDTFRSHFDGVVNYCTAVDGNGVCKVQITCTALADFLKEWFGHLAGNKHIPAWVYGLPEEHRAAFMEGYRLTDGCRDGNAIGYTTISRELAYGTADLCSFSSITFVKAEPTKAICGRTVNQHSWFRTGSYLNGSSRKFHRNGRWLFGRIRKFELQEQPETVYNLEVEDDNSYICNGLCVHNCQSYSIAGLRKGLSDPRGNLALEFVRLAYRSDARWTVWENVPGVLSSGGGGDFASFLSLLCGWEVPVPKDGWGKCGIVTNAPGCYGLAWRILDAQYTRVPMFPRAIPQRRRRIFVVGYRGGAVGSPLDWQHPAAVLFDGEMRERDTPPRREAAPGASPASPGGAEAPGQRGVVSLIPYGMRLGAHEDGVASTIARIDAKFPQCVCREEEQQREKNGFNFELFTGECREHSPCLGATRASDTMVYDGEEPETIRMREGCSGGGKGPLISRNVSLTLATANDQTLFEKKAVWWDGSEKADTLTCTSDAQRMPDKKKLQCVLDMRQIEANGTDVSPTLISTDYKGGKAVVETPGGESPDSAVCPMLEANLFNKNTVQDCDKFLIEKHDKEPVCFTQNQRDEIRLLGGDGQVAGAVCSMQATKQQNFIAYENHAQDSRVKDVGDVSPTLTGQMGTGGNNAPFVQKVDGKGVWRDERSLPPCFHLNTRDELIPTEIPGALMATRNERMQAFVPVGENKDMEDAEKRTVPAGKPLAFIKNDAGGVQQGYWEDVFPTMRTDITPAVAQRECFSITPCDANGTRADRPDGGLYVTQADASKTLTRGNPNTETVVVEPPVISLDGDKMGKADRAGGSGLGVNTEDVMYTQTVKDVHAVAYGASFEPNYGCPVEEELAHTQKCGTAPGTYNGVMTVDVGCDLYNGKETGSVAATMSANSCATPTRNGLAVVKVDTVVDMMGGKSGCHVSQENVSPTLATTHGESHAVAYGINCQASLMHPFSEEVSQVLAVSHQSGVVRDECVPIDMRNATRDADKQDEVNRQGVGVGEDGAPAPTVTASPGGVGWRATVRRLLPVETERLMGFPDEFTKIPWKGKPAEECPDAPRYKACGNSMCTNVMNWIGLRIQQEEEKIQDERKRQHEEHG